MGKRVGRKKLRKLKLLFGRNKQRRNVKASRKDEENITWTYFSGQGEEALKWSLLNFSGSKMMGNCHGLELWRSKTWMRCLCFIKLINQILIFNYLSNFLDKIKW